MILWSIWALLSFLRVTEEDRVGQSALSLSLSPFILSDTKQTTWSQLFPSFTCQGTEAQPRNLEREGLSLLPLCQLHLGREGELWALVSEKPFLQQFNHSQNFIVAHWILGTETQTPCHNDSVYG